MIGSPSSLASTLSPVGLPPQDSTVRALTTPAQAVESGLFAAATQPEPSFAQNELRSPVFFLGRPCTSEDLMLVAMANNLSDLRTFLQKNKVDINVKDKQGRTALMLAAFSGHQEACKRLCDLGANRAVTDRNGNTPLMHAAQEGHVAVVKILLQQVTPVVLNAKSTNGKTALSLAVRHGNAEMCQLLLDAGAVVNRKCSHLNAALCKSIKSGENEKSLILIGVGLVGEPSRNPFWQPLRIWWESLCAPALNREEFLRPSSFELAVQYADVRVCKALWNSSVPRYFGRQAYLKQVWCSAVRRKSDPKVGTAQQALFEKNSKEICELLLNASVKVDFQPKDDQQSDWHTALVNGDLGVCRVLLAAGADIEAHDRYGRSPLVIAANYGHKELFLLLWMNGADYASVQVFLDSQPLIMASQRIRRFLAAAALEIRDFARRQLHSNLNFIFDKDVASVVTSYCIPAPIPVAIPAPDLVFESPVEAF